MRDSHRRTEADPTRVLFLCLGNICRSPLAEGAFLAALASRVGPTAVDVRIEVDSAGTGGWHAGEAPDPRSVAIARANGVDISQQRARQLTADDFAHCDWIVAMDEDNLRTAASRRPAGEAFARARLVAFMDYVPDDTRAGVPDPYYGGVDGFRAVWTLLERGMPELLRVVLGPR